MSSLLLPPSIAAQSMNDFGFYIEPQYNFYHVRSPYSCSVRYDRIERDVQHAEDIIGDIIANLSAESRARCAFTLSDNKRVNANRNEAARLCEDEWRYLLHSVDGLNA